MNVKQVLKVQPIMFTMTPNLWRTAAERLEQGVQLQSAEGDFIGGLGFMMVQKKYAEAADVVQKGSRKYAEATHKEGSQITTVKVSKDRGKKDVDGIRVVRVKVECQTKYAILLTEDHCYEVYAVGEDAEMSFSLIYAKQNEQ